MKWEYVLTIDHLDGNWHYKDGTPVILRTETYRSRTLEGISKQYAKHNYRGSVEDLNCRYLINGESFYYDNFRKLVYFE